MFVELYLCVYVEFFLIYDMVVVVLNEFCYCGVKIVLLVDVVGLMVIF